MSSINPFSRYLLDEAAYPMEEEKTSMKAWTLDEGIF